MANFNVLCGVATVLMLGGWYAPAAGADDPRIDTATGRDKSNYPPDRHFDHLHMKLELDIPDMAKPQLKAVQTLRLSAVGRDRDVIELDAGRRIAIEAIEVNGTACPFEHKDGKLRITLAKPIRMGQAAELVTRYTVDYPAADGTGLTWTAGRPTAASATDKAAQIHSQGQPDYNHTWFPCQDFPNERATTELIVTVEDGYIVGSNGHLVGTRYAGVRDGRPFTTWHWLQDQPHCYYLVSMIVGKFAIVGLPPPAGEPKPKRAGGLPLECYLYAPLGTEQTAQKAYAKTPAMVAHFNERFGELYPWDKYSQALVRRFRAGGMENTSATTMQSSSARAPAGSQDGIIAHELAHQWFGDLVTCNSWEHAWLNEGWASFSEAIWEEAAASKNKKQAYQRRIAGFLGAQRAMNRTSAPLFPPMVSKRWGDPMETFMKPNDIYSKGAVVLHMLRQRLGDEVFWTGVRAYIQKYRLGTVETDDFRRCLEAASGQSLERFFTQWCYRPGLPRLAAELEWRGAGPEGTGELFIAIEQTQPIDADNPAYAFSLPVLLKMGDKGNRTVFVDCDQKHSEATFRLDAKPEDAVLDPQLSVAAPTSIKKPLAMWLEQADDESLFAQLQAVEHLREFEDATARQCLARIAGDDTRADLVREAAAFQLAAAYRRKLQTLLRVPPLPTDSRRPSVALAGEGATR